ncbi:uncharacterized protein LOC123702209 isoform X2 [Colias croceus]|uniref:uncharacterized protein LOC123699204 isoform X2 n=1 Tax=Colias crocea TaxID=72248 RepID=UPI001E27BA47|nr:uncharacterized protein LOC123699204 isoform X2 [Colias croceus]XP_045502059.1 uncharacterized protein LOC123699204 isoform X2 [Colias croceus]XP_045504752.1 uncharacterized protein LOC123701362 isoform X2 [Colias croceus]XP_045504754.1 uncharacterized protein LOC123701362 isoform X2 [Colias croceus]XP_045505374.1 uncharacterized protein LOC123701837 isoform X2 [Colias croceus]XP_045505375.1 uncharacterized protein LOC123701837 isoform X2 [Colias croceus]XP_045505846.1 uncharacterized prot
MNARSSRASILALSRLPRRRWRGAATAPQGTSTYRSQVLVLCTEVKETTAVHTLSRYMRTQQLKTHFWNRFHKEYITELQKRQKWRKDGGQLKLGEMVVVKDERLHPNQWLLGRVTRLHPGSDGVTRVADVLTSSGIQRRAFNRLCPLPIEDQNSVPGPATC